MKLKIFESKEKFVCHNCGGTFDVPSNNHSCPYCSYYNIEKIIVNEPLPNYDEQENLLNNKYKKVNFKSISYVVRTGISKKMNGKFIPNGTYYVITCCPFGYKGDKFLYLCKNTNNSYYCGNKEFAVVFPEKSYAESIVNKPNKFHINDFHLISVEEVTVDDGEIL